MWCELHFYNQPVSNMSLCQNTLKKVLFHVTRAIVSLWRLLCLPSEGFNLLNIADEEWYFLYLTCEIQRKLYAFILSLCLMRTVKLKNRKSANFSSQLFQDFQQELENCSYAKQNKCIYVNMFQTFSYSTSLMSATFRKILVVFENSEYTKPCHKSLLVNSWMFV